MSIDDCGSRQPTSMTVIAQPVSGRSCCHEERPAIGVRPALGPDGPQERSRANATEISREREVDIA